MSRNPFGKNLLKIRFEDIQSLKDRQWAEDEFLEYKREIPTRLDLQKEVLGFANNLGGYLVIGVRSRKPENVLEEIVGVAKEDNLTERIVSIVRDNSSPPFVPVVHLIDLPSDSTRCILIVFSHESDTVHRASDGQYYYRTTNETIPIRPEFVAKIIGKEKIRLELDKIVGSLDWRNREEFKGRNIGHDCWFGIICCPIPPKSFNISLFSEIEWYRNLAIKGMGGTTHDWRSYKDSFRVFIPRVNASPRAIIEFYEDGLILSGRVLPHGKDSPAINQNWIATLLDDFLNLIIEVYNKASFEGGLLLIISFNNIEKWHWTMGDYWKDLGRDALPSDEAYLETRYETTVLAVESDVPATRDAILTKLRRHFNIY